MTPEALNGKGFAGRGRKDVGVNIESGGWHLDPLPEVIALAREAGKAIIGFYDDANPTSACKNDRSPLTEVDLVSSRTILNGLFGLPPAWPVLSEETEDVAFEERRVIALFLPGRPTRWQQEVLGAKMTNSQ